MPTVEKTPRRKIMTLTPEEQRRRYDFEYSQAFTLAAASGSASQAQIKTEADSYFVCTTMMADATAPFMARMRDDGSGQIWQSDFVSSLNCFGTRERPNLMVSPILIPPMSSIVFDLQNYSLAGNTGEIVLGGYKLFSADFKWDPQQKLDTWFQYVASKAVAAGGIDTITMRLQADAHFQVEKLLARKAGLPATGQFSARISDSDTGKSWTDRSVRRDNQFGTAQYPGILPWPKLLRPNIVVTVEVTNLTALPNNIEVVVEGTKRYI